MIDAVRENFDRLRNDLPITVRPLDAPAWTKARFGLGPFPALLDLDEESGFASVFVALHGFYEEETAAVLSDLNLPRPLLHTPRFFTDPVLIEYTLEFGEVTSDRALQLLATASMLVVELAGRGWEKIALGWQEHYGAFGLAPGDANTAEPWRLLRSDPIPFYPWDDLDCEPQRRTPDGVLANLTAGDWIDLEDLLLSAREAERPRQYEAGEALQFVRRCLLLNNEDFLRPAENSRPIEEWSIGHTLATLSRMAVFDSTPFANWVRLFDDETIPRLLRRVASVEC